MPNNTTKPKKEVKKARLTLSELASYDDICTDGLVDKVRCYVYWQLGG